MTRIRFKADPRTAAQPRQERAAGPVLYCGDPHGRCGHILDAALDVRGSAVVLLGDIEAPRSLDLEFKPLIDEGIALFFIPGNHDSDSEVSWRHLFQDGQERRNLHGRVAVLPDGTRVAGLGGVFRASVWYPQEGDTLDAVTEHRLREQHTGFTPSHHRREERPSLKRWTSIFPEDVRALADQRADILVTHEAPGYHRHGFALLDHLARAMGVKAVTHGHHHDRLDSSGRWASQGFKSYGIGLRGITAVDSTGHASVVLAGELDEQRSNRPILGIDDAGDGT